MRKFETEVKVGLFVSIGIGLVMLAILILGSAQNLMVRKTHFDIYFQSVEGLIPGAKVVLGGIQVGVVKSVDLVSDRQKVKVEISIERKSGQYIRSDSYAEIATQGVLGDKYIALVPGNIEKPILAEGAEIPVRPGKDIAQFLNKGDQLIVTLQNLAVSVDRLMKTFEASNRADTFFQGLAQTSKNLAGATDKLNRELETGNLRKSLQNLAAILEKINNGKGSLGALVNDPGLYDDAKALVGGANRNRVVRNLVRQTVKDADKKEAEQNKKDNK